MDLVQQVEQEQLKSDIPDFAPGDTVRVHVRISEGGRERVQDVVPLEGLRDGDHDVEPQRRRGADAQHGKDHEPGQAAPAAIRDGTKQR